MATASAATAKSASALPAGKELAIAYTYAASDAGGRAHNPSMAVWIEDPGGAALRTLEVSFEQGGRGRKYLHDLVRWYDADQIRQIAGGVDVTTTVSRRPANAVRIRW